MTVARSLIHKNNVLKGGIDSPSKLAKSSMIGMYQVKKVSSGVSRFKFCWSKVNPQTVTIFENKMPSIDRIEFSSQLVPLFVFVFVQQLFWCVRPNLEKTGLKINKRTKTIWEWHLCVVGHLLRLLLDLVELVAALTHLVISMYRQYYFTQTLDQVWNICI